MQERVGKQISMEIQRMLNKELGELGVSVFRKQCAEMKIKPEDIQLRDLLDLSQRIIRALRPTMGNDAAQKIGKEIQKFKILSELRDIQHDTTPFAERRELDAYAKLGNIAYTIGDWDDALEYYGKVKALGEKYRDHLKVAEAYRIEGHIYKRQSRWEDGLKAFEAGLRALEGTDSAAGVSDAHRGMGYIHWRMGDYERAKNNFETAMKFAEQSGDRVMVGLVHIEWGLVFSDLGNLEEAIGHYKESMAILEQAREYQQLSRAYNNLGDIYLQTKEWDSAIKYFELCRSAAEKMNHLNMIGWSLFNSAEALSMSGRPQEAIPRCREAIDILEKLHDHVGVSAAYRNLGLAHTFLKDWNLAEQNFREAETRLDRINSPFNTAHLHMEWGSMCAAKGDKKKAKIHLEKAVVGFGQLGAKKYLENAQGRLAEL
ncbi:MAG: tetratricopeptide repeat protein [Thermoplasmata archaeon]|nr:tetratricopeptide repeat protein [Thermoplasmata archaeon]